MKTLVVTPVYNCSRYMNKLLTGIGRFVPDMLVIDDGSTDDTAAVAHGLNAEVIRNGLRKGKGAALKIGFRYALDNDFDAVITMDGDGQHKPEYLPSFQSALQESGADLVIGSRKGDWADMPWDRRFSNYCTSRLLSALLKTDIEDSQGGYRMISRKLLERLELDSDKYELETEMIIKTVQEGFRIKFIPIKVEYEAGQTSHINRFVDTLRWIRLVLELI